MRENRKRLNYTPADFVFQYVNPIEYVEAWFDNHPFPADIERFVIRIKRTKIEIFAARDVFDTWLIKITYVTAKKAMTQSKEFKPISDTLGITQILIYNKLFLFQDQRF
jgi:hypothetical protein